ncbi:MAG: hypothetical protein WA964_14785 [Ilumatobacter sp.]|uniref:hypothetical protein n=1 Tax=Ilumatobacter sp. TaxID=1967498 RepID=UPI003C770ADF
MTGGRSEDAAIDNDGGNDRDSDNDGGNDSGTGNDHERQDPHCFEDASIILLVDDDDQLRI